jgi:hypothetical protein
MRVWIYDVDIGTWAQGRTHTVCAVCPVEAYRIAVREYLGGSDNDYHNYVVQIREVKGRWSKYAKGRCVYDYLNGFGLWE